jgi:hypothetical protein
VSLNVHHRRGLAVLTVTLALDAGLGISYARLDRIPLAHGLYCALGTATTVGCDIAPRNPAAYAFSALMMLTVVPLFAAVFSFFTTGLTADHVDKRHKQMTEHVTTTAGGGA